MNLIAILLILLAAGCQPSPPPGQPVAPFHFRFEREGCFGNCPKYQLEVLSTGEATLREFPSNSPAVESRGHISTDRIRVAVSKFRPFAQPASNFPSDAPFVAVELRDGNGVHRVRDAAVESRSQGEKIYPSTPLNPFADEMDRIVHETTWKRTGA